MGKEKTFEDLSVNVYVRYLDQARFLSDRGYVRGDLETIARKLFLNKRNQ